MQFHRILNYLAVLVRQMTSRYDYAALYAATVVSQNADGSCEVKPDVDAFGPGLSSVPYRSGIPGVTVNLIGGARCLLGFDGLDPAKPYVVVYDAAQVDSLTVTSVTKITVNAPHVNLGDEDGDNVARIGDLVTSALPPAVPVTGTLNGLPFVGVMVVADPIIGVITASSAKTYAS